MKHLMTRKVPFYWLLLAILAALLTLAAVLMSPWEIPSVSPAVMAADPVNGLSEGQLNSLEGASISREEIGTMTKEQALARLKEIEAVYTANYDAAIQERFEGDFAELAEAGEGVYYDWKNNRLIGTRQVDVFLSAVKSKATGGFVYFADSAYEPFICSFSVNGGDDFFTINLYRPDGSKETLESRDAYKGDSYYRFGNDAFAPSLPVYIPFGEDDPAEQKIMEEYYNRYVANMLYSGLLIDAWNSPATLNPERLMTYYLFNHLLPQRSISDADTVEIEGAKLEADILANFDMPVRRIRAADNYNEANQTYRFTGGVGTTASGRVTNYTWEGDQLTLECDFYGPQDSTTVIMKCRLKLQVQGDSYEYLSNGSWDWEL